MMIMAWHGRKSGPFILQMFLKACIEVCVVGMVLMSFGSVLISTSYAQAMPSRYARGLSEYKAGNYLEAFKLWRPLAQQGHGRAQYGLGLLFEDGLGLKQNYKQAAKWYMLAVKQNVVPAFVNLGHLYAQGKFVEKDYAEAARLWLSAAEMGNSYAIYNLGVMYFTGAGSEVDKIKAKYYFEKAAFNGVAEAQLQLSEMQRFAVGEDQDMQQAVYWLHQAVKQGHVVAQERLNILAEVQPQISKTVRQAENLQKTIPISVAKVVPQKTPIILTKSVDKAPVLVRSPTLFGISKLGRSVKPRKSQAKKTTKKTLHGKAQIKYPVLWLASFKKKQNTSRYWREMKQKFPHILKELKLYVYDINLPNKGVWHRVYGTGLASIADGLQRCDEIKLSNPTMYCRVLPALR